MTTTSLKLASVPMACAASVNGKGRCRHWAQQGTQFCAQHKDTKRADMSPSPFTILVKAAVDPKTFQHLVKIGIPVQERDEEALRAAHAAEAEAIGRSPTAIRDTPDSGCPIFGPDGLKKVGLCQLFLSLAQNEYGAIDVHIYQRPKDLETGAGMLVLTYEHQPEDPKVAEPTFERRVEGAIRLINATAWRYLHVWENPPKEDDNVLSTVNVGGPMKPGQYPDYELVMHRFRWGVTAVEKPSQQPATR